MTMAERKHLSETDQSSSNNSKKRKLIQTTIQVDTSTRPMCKYGAKCYRKHPDHLRDYRHPLKETKEDDHNDSLTSQETDSRAVSSLSRTPVTTDSSSLSPTKQITRLNNATVSLMALLELNGEKLLSHVYQMEFPSDLYDFWKFCTDINKTNPRGKKKKR